jgi:hypothetical protein
MRSKNEVLCAAAGRLAAERCEADKPAKAHKTIFAPNNIYVELVPTLMIDDAETKMRTEASLLFELKTSVPFCQASQICELIYVDIYLARNLK